MTRSLWLTRGVAIVAAVLSVGWLCAASRADRELRYPRPCCNCCVPNVRGFGHYETNWRVWPGDENLPERIAPRTVGLEAIKTPPGQEEVPLPTTATPQPSTPVPGKPEPRPLPPSGTIIPPEGLLMPGSRQPAQPPAEQGPSSTAPGEHLPGLEGLPPEPDVTRPPPPTEQLPPKAGLPATEPAKPVDAPKPDRKAMPQPKDHAAAPSIQTPQWSDWREDRPPGATMAPNISQAGKLPREMLTPANNRKPWPDRVVSPVGGLEPERSAALPGAYRADSIASAPADWQANRVEPAAYATAEPPARPDAGQVGNQPRGVAADAAVPPVALNGYCPVELAQNGRWVAGDLRWTVVHQGQIYRLSGAQQRQQFLANPDSFAPVNSGSDAVLLVEQHRTVAGQPAYCATYDGRLYMFAGADTQARFNANPQRYVAWK